MPEPSPKPPADPQQDLRRVAGVGAMLAMDMVAMGIRSPGDLAQATPRQLKTLRRIGDRRAAALIEAAQVVVNGQHATNGQDAVSEDPPAPRKPPKRKKSPKRLKGADRALAVWHNLGSEPDAPDTPLKDKNSKKARKKRKKRQKAAAAAASQD